MRHAFIVGSPRSGTTWLQMMLSAHPSIASGRETHVFSRYISKIMGIIRFDLDQPSVNGVAKLLGEQSVYEYCKEVADKCFEKLLENSPNAKVVLEKTPNHINYHDLILNFYPKAYFIQVMRDPRGVVASLRAAGQTDWGRQWAPTDVIAAANRWMADTQKGTKVAHATQRYRMVKYEDLHSQDPEVLRDLFAWMEVDASPERCREIFQSLSMDRVRQKTTPDRVERLRDGRNCFFREGKTDAWRDDLTTSEVRVIDYICRTEMEPLGSKIDGANPSRPLAVRWHEFRERLKRRIEKATKRMVKKL